MNVMDPVLIALAIQSAVNAPRPVSADPIEIRNQRSVALPFLRMPFRTRVLPPGERERNVHLSISNEMRRRGGTLEDSETTRIAYTERRGTAKGEFWFEVPILSRGGGFLDPIIDGWHKNVLGWSDPVRNGRPMNRAIVTDGIGYQYGTASGLGDVTVGGSAMLKNNLIGSVAVKLPTGRASKLLGSGSVDIGASVAYSKQLNKQWQVAGQVGLVMQGHSRDLKALSVYGLVDQQSLAFIWTRNSRDTWIAQWQSERAPIRGKTGNLNGPHRMLTFGYRRQLGRAEWLELAFTEDEDVVNRAVPLVASTAPDFGASFRYVWRF
jgi:hypothetical protein